MKLIICILSITLVGILLLSTVSSNAQEEKKKEPWTGKLKDGTIINKDDLSKILEEHKKWIGTEGKEGQQAYLYLADLSGADLSEAYLRGANLVEAKMSGADLSGANLSGADLYLADLSGADLREVNLSRANVVNTNFSYSKFEPDNIEGLTFLGAKVFQVYSLQKLTM